MTNNDSRLDQLFLSYRASCPDMEPGVNFMPRLWEKIEARYRFGFVFGRLARTAMTASAALCFLLLVLNLVSSPQNRINPATYLDALMADHTAEKTYYTEAIRSTPANDEAPEAIQH